MFTTRSARNSRLSDAESQEASTLQSSSEGTPPAVGSSTLRGTSDTSRPPGLSHNFDTSYSWPIATNNGHNSYNRARFATCGSAEGTVTDDEPGNFALTPANTFYTSSEVNRGEERIFEPRVVDVQLPQTRQRSLLHERMRGDNIDFNAFHALLESDAKSFVDDAPVPSKPTVLRSSSMPAKPALKSASASLLTGPLSLTEGHVQKKKARIDDRFYHESPSPTRNAASNTWPYHNPATSSRSRRDSAPPQVLTRLYSGLEDELFGRSIELEDEDLDELNYLRESLLALSRSPSDEAPLGGTNEVDAIEAVKAVHKFTADDAHFHGREDDATTIFEPESKPASLSDAEADEDHHYSKDTESLQSNSEENLDDDRLGNQASEAEGESKDTDSSSSEWARSFDERPEMQAGDAEDDTTNPASGDTDSLLSESHHGAYNEPESGSSSQFEDNLEIESAARVVHEWSGEVQEHPAIEEDDSIISVNAGGSTSIEVQPRRRASEAITQRRSQSSKSLRRTNSISEICMRRGRVRVQDFVPPKAAPASPALSACSVHVTEPHYLITAYGYPAEHFRHHVAHNETRTTSQTIHSGYGTVQMLWEEPTLSTSSSADTLLVDSTGVDVFLIDDAGATVRKPSPMEKVKTKLTAWSWARERMDNEDERPRWLPLLQLDKERHPSNSSSDRSPYSEVPAGPPNTERESGTTSAHMSRPGSPTEEHIKDDDEDDTPAIELNVRPFLARPHTAYTTRAPSPSPYHLISHCRRSSVPASPSISRQLSQLGAEDLTFRSHRDSVDITRGHLLRREEQDTDATSRELVDRHQDSFLLTKSKFESKYPKPWTTSSDAWNRSEGLSPVMDASPTSSV